MTHRNGSNERFLNLPPQLAPQALRALTADIKEATDKGDAAFDVDYYMVLAKSYEIAKASAVGGGMGKKRSKKKRKLVETEFFYSNAEDEVFAGAAEMAVTFKIASAADGSTKHYRTVLLIPKAKLAGAIAEIARLLPLEAENITKLL